MQKTEAKSIWSHPPDILELRPRQVDIWRISLDLQPAIVKPLDSTLSTDESQRAARFHFQKDRERYIIAHAGLRDILSRYLHCGPGQLSFFANDHGKPALNGHQLEFNLSHSGGFALIALTRECKVGVDVEYIRSEMEFESIARRFFSPNEVSELMALHPEQRKLAFFRCWTRKEAYIKAQGLGLSLPLESFDVSLTPDEPVILRATRPDPQEAARWTLSSLEVDPGYTAAAAVEEKDVDFRLWDWNSVIQ